MPCDKRSGYARLDDLYTEEDGIMRLTEILPSFYFFVEIMIQRYRALIHSTIISACISLIHLYTVTMAIAFK